MKTTLLLLLLTLVAAEAFNRAVFRGTTRAARRRSGLFAEAPQYEKVDAVLTKVETLARGSVLLRVETDGPVDYRAGHVLALEIEGVAGLAAGGKNAEDARANGGWLRGPYTVSRASSNSFDVLVRVVGEKSRAFSRAAVGTPVRFGGKYHVPIVAGIDRAAVRRVVFVSTGVGIGPCVGAVEEALADAAFPPIAVFACYRHADEVVYAAHWRELAAAHEGRLAHTAIVSAERGRLSANEENLRLLLSEEVGPGDTHYHLIGNGQMVAEFQAGLEKAGVPAERVTIEKYFNHKAAPDQDAIDRIASVLDGERMKSRAVIANVR